MQFRILFKTFNLNSLGQQNNLEEIIFDSETGYKSTVKVYQKLQKSYFDTLLQKSAHVTQYPVTSTDLLTFPLSIVSLPNSVYLHNLCTNTCFTLEFLKTMTNRWRLILSYNLWCKRLSQTRPYWMSFPSPPALPAPFRLLLPAVILFIIYSSLPSFLSALSSTVWSHNMQKSLSLMGMHSEVFLKLEKLL